MRIFVPILAPDTEIFHDLVCRGVSGRRGGASEGSGKTFPYAILFIPIAVLCKHDYSIFLQCNDSTNRVSLAPLESIATLYFDDTVTLFRCISFCTAAGSMYIAAAAAAAAAAQWRAEQGVAAGSCADALLIGAPRLSPVRGGWRLR